MVGWGLEPWSDTNVCDLGHYILLSTWGFLMTDLQSIVLSHNLFSMGGKK